MHKISIEYSHYNDYLEIEYEDITNVYIEDDDGILFHEGKAFIITEIANLRVKDKDSLLRNKEIYCVVSLDEVKIIIDRYMKSYNNIRFMWDECSFYPSYGYPNNVERLHFYECLSFNHSLDNLPMNLKELNIQYLNPRIDFVQSLDHLPYYLESLIIDIDGEFCSSLLNLPIILKVLVLTINISDIDAFSISYPSNLEVLLINIDIDLNDIPDSVKHLTLLSSNRKPINKLPEHLQQITFGSEYHKYNWENYDRIQQLIRVYPYSIECNTLKTDDLTFL